jgi:quinohemoprotein amine dehydrogenase
MSNHHRWLASLGIVLAVIPLSVSAQRGRGGRGGSSDAPAEVGIPVLNADVQNACGSCHASDDKKMMSRISYRRASPENWELTIRRMVSLNNANLSPEMARKVIKDLADNHGLAPEEALPAAFEAERRLVDFTYPDKETTDACSMCHSLGRVISERRTSEEWALLLAMHRGYYPEASAFRAGRGGGGGGAPADGGGQGAVPAPNPPAGQGNAPAAAGGRGGAAVGGRGGAAPGGRGAAQMAPADRALNHLVQTFPLQSPEWASWSAAMRSPKLAGRWAFSGYQPGKGPVYGQVTIADQPGTPDGFLTESRLVYAATGQSETRKSRGLVYTGFQWRGRSADATSEQNTWREVAFIDRGWSEITGRWFTGAYDEIGMDVTLRRVATDPVVLGTNVASLKQSSTGRSVRIYGANFPQRVLPTDIDFGQGVKVARVTSVTRDIVTVDVDVAADARVGPRNLWVAGASKTAALVVYDKIDGIKVLPEWGMARTGGVVVPMQMQQFEAVAVNYGADGKANTKDDLNLGAVPAAWALEEYPATFKDDDVKFVGELNSSGLFVPNFDRPNPQRPGNRNNVGDVWVVASYTPEGSTTAMHARAALLVTVPVYLNWEPKQIGLER